MRLKQRALFEDMRLQLEDSIDLSISSLREYGEKYRHWAIAYSGGKDSTAVVAFVGWAIREGLIPKPERLTVEYADTRMELPPLQASAIGMLKTLRSEGIETFVVHPRMDDRYFVYMFGRGVPPPKNRFRWCTPQLKITPMQHALEDLAVELGYGEIVPTTKNRYGREYRNLSGEKILMLTGVRFGESVIRDERILLSCSRDDGECGQGWFQVSTPKALADTLAPLLHWRLCHVFDWLYFDDRHGYNVAAIADVYGEDEVRTGCVGCNLASRDTALERLVKRSEYEHLRPLMELKPLYRELAKAKHRKRKAGAERKADGTWGKNPQRKGPLSIEARAYGLEKVLDIQARSGMDLINQEEETRIREMWDRDIWPDKWSSEDIDAIVPLDAIYVVNGELVKQSLLI